MPYIKSLNYNYLKRLLNFKIWQRLSKNRNQQNSVCVYHEGVQGISNTCGSKQSLNIELILHHAMPPKWKRNPPCTSHKILEKMFSEDKISRDAQPSTVYNL